MLKNQGFQRRLGTIALSSFAIIITTVFAIHLFAFFLPKNQSKQGVVSADERFNISMNAFFLRKCQAPPDVEDLIKVTGPDDEGKYFAECGVRVGDIYVSKDQTDKYVLRKIP